MKKQIHKVLPKAKWEGVRIEECGEPLVKIARSSRLVILHKPKGYEVDFRVRESVANKLEAVANGLPDGMQLGLIEGFRSVESQRRLWDGKVQAFRKQMPDLSDLEIEQKVAMVVARPSPLANHNCGGAVDVTLCDEEGRELDMGTPYIDEGHTSEVRRKYPMFAANRFGASLINRGQRSNRKILREAMESQGFAWYPGEWWHYCWGDRMWAVYSGWKECCYGPVIEV